MIIKGPSRSATGEWMAIFFANRSRKEIAFYLLVGITPEMR